MAVRPVEADPPRRPAVRPRAADDKGAISAFLGAIAAYRKTGNTLPVNIKMLVEGEEEVGSKNLHEVLRRPPATGSSPT